MGFVIEALFVVGVASAVVWALGLRKAATKDRADAREQQKKAEEASARTEREARLLRPGEPLRCLGCDTTFAGPLTAQGCPNCHSSALVVAEEDFRRGKQAAAEAAEAEAEVRVGRSADKESS